MPHISKEQRCTIEVLLTKGNTLSYIAETINKDKSVVSREIRRNQDKRGGKYNADLAHRKSEERKKNKKKKIRFTKSITAKVDELITIDYSPEQIVGYSK
jgi:transposase, IS30 family